MNLSDLQKKDIINLDDGNNLGRIVDVEINEDGKIIKVATEPKTFFKRIFKHTDSEIYFSSIVKIGSDVILVKESRIEL